MAGRKDKNTVDYFPHYCDSGKTLFIIESTFKHVGYAIWFKTLELLGSSDNHYIDLRDDTDLLFLVSKLKVTESQLTSIYDLCAKLGAIDEFLWNNKIVFSENFISNIEDAYKRRSNTCLHKLDLCKHLSILCEQKSTICEQKSTKKSKVKESKEDEIKEDNYRSFAHLSLSHSDYEKLIEFGYSNNQIDNILDSIENYKDNKKYKSLYLTAKKWLQKEYSDIKPKVDAGEKVYRVQYTHDCVERYHTEAEIEDWCKRMQVKVITKF